jgi:hypothetical protein
MTSLRQFLGIAAIFLMSGGGCAWFGHDRRDSPPPEIHGPLIDVSQSEPSYEPIDPEKILALKEALQKSYEVQHDPNEQKLPPVNVLAISGGGSYGAFDVGVLHGWTDSGTRPVFDVVTGISTGALIATFAFLGPQYDEFLRDSYVKTRASDVYQPRWLISIFNSASIARSTPLRKRIDATITPEVLAEIAKAHAQGRRLYVGTTNLDTRKFIVWDMGAIASAGTPEALALYRKIILASASIPVFFPPVLIDVEVDGCKHQEMHVDGGTTSAVFVPMNVIKCDPRKPFIRPGSNVYVISSGKLYADGDAVKRKFLSVTANSISALVYSGARNDIFRIFNMALLCGMDFHLIAIPQDFPLVRDSLSFDPKELQRLYDLGYEMGRTRRGWRETPPGTEISEQSLPRTGTKFATQKLVQPQ